MRCSPTDMAHLKCASAMLPCATLVQDSSRGAPTHSHAQPADGQQPADVPSSVAAGADSSDMRPSAPARPVSLPPSGAKLKKASSYTDVVDVVRSRPPRPYASGGSEAETADGDWEFWRATPPAPPLRRPRPHVGAAHSPFAPGGHTRYDFGRRAPYGHARSCTIHFASAVV